VYIILLKNGGESTALLEEGDDSQMEFGQEYGGGSQGERKGGQGHSVFGPKKQPATAFLHFFNFPLDNTSLSFAKAFICSRHGAGHENHSILWFFKKQPQEKFMKKMLILLPLVLLVAVSAQASELAKDYIFRGMPEYKIEERSRGFEKLKIKQGSQELAETVYEGNQVYSWYIYRGRSEDLPSSLHQTRYHKEAVKKLGGQILWEDGEERNFHAAFKRNDKQYYMAFDSGRGGYKVWILEPAELQVDVEIIDSDTILHKLNTEGHIALYIHFDTGKATIKPESKDIIDEIVSALKTQADLKVKLEGHTDNLGTPAGNKKLSNERANAVMNAIIAKGINKSRLSAAGFGMEKPIANNTTEEGRTKNRRVEMVKQEGAFSTQDTGPLKKRFPSSKQ